MAVKTDLCPVCGRPAAMEAPDVWGCPECGFAYSQVKRFAGSGALAVWRQAAAGEKRRLLERVIGLCARQPVFGFGGGALTFTSPQDGRLYLVEASGIQPQRPEVRQYSAPENTLRNKVFLLSDGRLEAEGDNEYGQCRTGNLHDIRRALATPRCTYAVTSEGNVQCCGEPFSPAVASWKNVQELAAGAYHLVGLTGDGRVLAAGDMLNSAVAAEIAGWREITAIACAGDATISLRRDGTVCFAGRPGDPREAVRDWSGIAAIAIESVYAAGLTADGRVLPAGRNSNDDLDLGRREAASWTNVAAIACSRSGIAALGMDGSVRLAGNIRDIGRLKSAWDSFSDTVRSQLLQAVMISPFV